MNAVSLDSIQSKLDNPWKDEIYVFKKQLQNKVKKCYINLVKLFLLILAVGCLFPGLSVILQVGKKEILQLKNTEIIFSAVSRKNNFFSFNLNRIFRKLVLIFILVR